MSPDKGLDRELAIVGQTPRSNKYYGISANGTPVTRHLTSVMSVCFRNKMITDRRTKFAFITGYEERSGVLA